MLNLFKVIIIGIIEGITEWLPISSTGHMILAEEFIRLNMSEEFMEMFNVVIQLGAILAVVLIFWLDIWPFGTKHNKHPLSNEGFGRYIKKDKFIMWFKIIVACIPAAIIGVLLDDWLDEHFYNYVVVAIALIVFGIAFIVVERLARKKKFRVNTVSEISWLDSLLIGVFQLLAAIFPGTSRSGSTIVGSIGIGIKREAAARFTFYLAIPVMFGASLLKILKFEGDVSAHEIGLLAVGMVTAFIVSIAVIKGLLAYIRKHDFTVFGYYRIILGIIVLICGATGVIGK